MVRSEGFSGGFGEENGGVTEEEEEISVECDRGTRVGVLVELRLYSLQVHMLLHHTLVLVTFLHTSIQLSCAHQNIFHSFSFSFSFSLHKSRTNIPLAQKKYTRILMTKLTHQLNAKSSSTTNHYFYETLINTFY